MIRYLGGRHGGLKYERYDGPRPHTIPFPRWCISANLRSLVLSLSFLPSSSATSSPPPSPLPLLLCPSSAPLHLSLALLVRILSPLLPLSFSFSLSISLFVLQRTCKCRYIYVYVCVCKSSRREEWRGEGRRGEKRSVYLYTCFLYLRAHLGTLLSAPSNRHDPLFGGHVLYMCVSVSPLSLSVFQTRSKSFDTWNLISDREIPDPEGDYRREKDLSRSLVRNQRVRCEEVF